METIMTIVVVLFVLGIWSLFCLIPAYMARQRGRSYWGWFFISFFLLSFVLSSIILLLLGDTDEKYKEKIKDRVVLEETYRKIWRMEN